MNKITIRLIISFIIAGTLIWWLNSQGFEIIPALSTIKEVTSIESLATYAGIFLVFHFLRAWRWTYLLRPFAKVPSGIMLKVAFTGFAAIQMMPLRTGEVARPYLLDKYTGISKSALFGTIAIERVIDGLMVSLALTVALFTIDAHTNPYIWTLRLAPVSIFTSALFLLVAFHKSPKTVRYLLHTLLGKLSGKLADFTVGVLERFHDGLAALPHVRYFWTFVTFSCLYWGINATAFYLLAQGCGLDLPFAGAVAGMGVLAVGILLPAGPGYFGNFQIAVLAALEMYITQAAQSPNAAVFVFALYLLQTGLTIITGTTSGIMLIKRNHDITQL